MNTNDDDDNDEIIVMMKTMMIAEPNARAGVAPYLGKCDNLPIREILVIT